MKKKIPRQNKNQTINKIFGRRFPHTIFWRFTYTTKGCVNFWRTQKVAKKRFLVWYIFLKLSFISLFRTSKCLRLEVLKPFYDCVNTNSVKITAYCAAKFRRCVCFFQISNWWCLSNFNVWHFSYFDCWFFSIS